MEKSSRSNVMCWKGCYSWFAEDFSQVLIYGRNCVQAEVGVRGGVGFYGYLQLPFMVAAEVQDNFKPR